MLGREGAGVKRTHSIDEQGITGVHGDDTAASVHDRAHSTDGELGATHQQAIQRNCPDCLSLLNHRNAAYTTCLSLSKHRNAAYTTTAGHWQPRVVATQQEAIHLASGMLRTH